MHYSPILPAAGLIVVGQVLPAESGPLLAARLLLDIAGIIFLLLAAAFVVANLVGTVQVRLAPSAASRHRARHRRADVRFRVLTR